MSKLSVKIRETHLFLNEFDVWDVCDVLITANPALLMIKPEGKLSIKIKTSYNGESTSDFEYDSLMNFMNDEDVIQKINKKF